MTVAELAGCAAPSIATRVNAARTNANRLRTNHLRSRGFQAYPRLLYP